MTRRCLAIAGVFPPYGGAGAVRWVKLLKYLPQHGWTVDVVAPRGRAGWHLDPSLGREIEQIRVIRVGMDEPGWAAKGLRQMAKDPHRSGLGHSLLRRLMASAGLVRNAIAIPDEYLLWAVAALGKTQALVREHPYDAVFTSSPPYSSHLVGLALLRMGGPPWLAEMRDPWVGHSFRFQAKGWRRWLDSQLERRVVRGASGVSVISPGMERQLRDLYGPLVSPKLGVVTNGFDPSDFAAAPPRKGRKTLRMLYVGSFSDLTPPDALLQALSDVLGKDPTARHRLELHILGGASLRGSEKIRKWIERHDAASMIVMRGFLPHRQAIKAMQSADALLLVVAPNAPWVLTSKVFEYLASGSPLLAAVPDGDCRNLLERCGGAWVTEPHNSPALAAKILAALKRGGFADEPPANVEELQSYNMIHLAGRVAEILDRLVA